MNRKDTFTYDSQNALALYFKLETEPKSQKTLSYRLLEQTLLIKHEKPGDNKNIFGFLLEQFD